MRKFIGHIRCPSCGVTYIIDPGQVTVYFNFDNAEQTAEVICCKCNQVVESKIDDQDIHAFKSRGIKFVPWHSKLPELSEEDIDNWDIEEELNEVAY